jgi:hypothetical protein
VEAEGRSSLVKASGSRLVRAYNKGNSTEVLLDPVGWVILSVCHLYVETERSGAPWLASEFEVELPAVDLNHLKEEMINQWETLLEIQSLEDVLVAPCVLADASFKITLSCRLGN